jgi:putative dimethyl sulfoxide reductase chaperone
MTVKSRTRRKPTKVKSWMDPDLSKKWEKFKKKYGYLFWVNSMNVKDDDEWYELIDGKQPDVSHEPKVPKTEEEYVDVLKNRREVYFQLFRCYTQPTKTFLTEVLDRSFSTNLGSSLKTLFDDPRIEEGEEMIAMFVERFGQRPFEKLYDSFSREYQTIFYDGFFPWLSCYESIYRSEKQLIGDCTQEVKDLYKLAGYQASVRFGNDPPDDLKLEMEFMFRMLEEELSCWKSGDKNMAIEYLKLQREHITKHLIEWVPYLCDDLINTEFKANIAEKFHYEDEEYKKAYEEGVVEADFYRGLSPITKAMLEHDHGQVDAMLKAAEDMDAKKISRLCGDVSKKDVSGEGFHLVKLEEMTGADKPYMPPHPNIA